MTKTSGLGASFYIGGVDLSGDIGSLSKISGGQAPIDLTPINKSAHERVGGLRTGEIDFMAYFNASAAQEHVTLSALPSTDVILSYLHGTTLGNPAACMVAKQINYDPTRGADGSFTINVQALSNAYGLEWVQQATAGQRTDTSATDGTGIDDTAQTTFGLQAYLHVFSVAGTSVTVSLEHSSDNGGADPFAAITGGAFAAVLAGATSAQRIATASGATIKRYIRIVTAGTFSSAVFWVGYARNQTSVVF